MEQTGVAGYRQTSGNQGVYMLRRFAGDRCQFMMLSLWESLDAIRAFAGEEHEAAVFYPEDDRFLIERDETAEHFEVVAAHGLVRGAPGLHGVRLASADDAMRIGKLLHDFNTEYDEPSPGPDDLAKRVRQLIDAGEITVLLAGSEPLGLAVIRFRPALWTDGLESYLEELYVVPGHRGRGLGRSLMEAAIELARARGAVDMHLGTGEEDVAARALYESLGFDNRGGRPDGAVNYFYEREL
jgi:ribosomal protein S18 acetylase RimI-like enzyme